MEDAALSTKIVCLVLFGVISLVCGLLPLLVSRLARQWKRRRTDKTEVRFSGRIRTMLSCVLCLGGGVLLGTVFTHMLPEIRELFLRIEGADLLPGMQPPAGEIFVCAGFFLVYMVEELVHVLLAGRASAKKRRNVAPAPAVASPSAVVVEIHGDRDAMAWHDKYAEPAAPSPPVTAAVTTATADAAEHDHGPAGHDHGSVVASLHALRAYIVIVALSVHSVFEGFAVAFETTSRDVWILFAAIATHKAIVAFCLGEQLLATKRSVCFVITNLLILSAASPLGVIIGLAVEQLDQDESSRLLATGLLQALAAGTILYVVFFEILAPERQKHGAGLQKFLAVVAGFALIVLMHSSGGHSHGGPGHGIPAVVHNHNEAHVHGHDHDHGHGSAGPVNSDYLARVPNESGHVYNTVRYIKSFSRQEPPTVDAGDIVAGMRSIAEDLGSTMLTAHRHDDHGEHDHREDGHHHEAERDATGAKGARGDTGHLHSVENGEEWSRTHHREDGHPGRHDHHDHHDHHDEHAESSSRRVGEPEEETGQHHHDHDQFMRTVEDLAGRLGGLDRRAVDRTVTLIDTLDLIAMQKTETGRGRGRGRKPQAGHSEPDHRHDHDHDRDHGHDHGHDHGQAAVTPSSRAVSAARPAAVADRSGGVGGEHPWPDDSHFGQPIDEHVQFVLQDPRTQAAQVRGSTQAPAVGLGTSTDATSSGAKASVWRQQELEAQRELDNMEEVRFHESEDHVNGEHTHAPAVRSPTTAEPVTGV